jgi:hypothetical protein
MKRIVLAAGVTVAVSLGTAGLAHASARPAATAPAPRPAVGISGAYNAEMCGSNDWERVKLPVRELAVSDSAGTCVDSERYNADFSIAAVTRNIGWQYPNMADGFTPEGEPTCASAADTCDDFPVQFERDGTPEESFAAWANPGVYNLANDIWFSPVQGMHATGSDRKGDTEIMIWWANPGINDTGHFLYYTTINGRRFGVMSWETKLPWRYVAYVAVTGNTVPRGRVVSASGQWLNPFFRDAEARGWLHPVEWLQAICIGFELNQGGKGNNVHSWTLAHVG